MIGHICSLTMVVYPLYRDVREKEVNLVPAILLLIIGSLAVMAGGKGNIKLWLLGLIPGVAMYILSRIFQNCIGSGDCFLAMGVGALEGVRFILRVLLVAAGLVFLFAIFMMASGKLNRKSQVAFVPFLALGYVGAMLL